MIGEKELGQLYQQGALLDEIIELVNRDSPIGHIVDNHSIYEAIQEIIDMLTNLEEQLEDVRSLIA